jgi:hypothetical protein
MLLLVLYDSVLTACHHRKGTLRTLIFMRIQLRELAQLSDLMVFPKQQRLSMTL